MNVSTTKGVATSRIRRRVRVWQGWQAESVRTVDHYAEQLRRFAEPKGKFSFQPRPALTPEQLRAEVEEAFCSTVRDLRDQLRAVRTQPRHMIPYHREQAIRILGALRERPKGREALEIVCAELPA